MYAFTPIRYHGYVYYIHDWDRYAKVDGWVCRDDHDCIWLDQKLGCNDREFSHDNIKVRKYLL